MALSRDRRITMQGYLLLTPSMLTLFLVVVFPLAYLFYLSLMNFTFGRVTGFAGLKNYFHVLTDSIFYESLKVTIIFTAWSVVGQLLLALLFAMVIHYSGAFEAGIRLLVILPYMISEVAGGVTLRWILNTEFGFVNWILMSLKLIAHPLNFLGEPAYAMASIIGANLWISVPFATLVLLAGLKSISTEIYESAQIDGAGFYRSFFSITLPLLRAQILVVLLIQTMFSFRHFPLPFAMTGGGPGATTKLLALVLQEKMMYLVFGYNAALSVIMMILTLAIAGLYLKFMTMGKE